MSILTKLARHPLIAPIMVAGTIFAAHPITKAHAFDGEAKWVKTCSTAGLCRLKYGGPICAYGGCVQLDGAYDTSWRAIRKLDSKQWVVEVTGGPDRGFKGVAPSNQVQTSCNFIGAC